MIKIGSDLRYVIFVHFSQISKDTKNGKMWCIHTKTGPHSMLQQTSKIKNKANPLMVFISVYVRVQTTTTMQKTSFFKKALRNHGNIFE